LEGYGNFSFNTAAVFRDTAAWYHVVVAIDTTQATNTNRIKLYVNGVLQSFSSASYPTQNTDTLFNSTNVHYVGTFSSLSQFFSGYLADVYFIDGQALDPSSFTETDATTGQLIPKAYSGTYTGNSFWLPFRDNSAATATTLGKDNFNLGNNWTPSNLSITAGSGNDSLVDVPTNGAQTDTGAGGEVRGNYCTWNPLQSTAATLANGNLDCTTAVGTGAQVRATIAVSSGKWYWELLVNTSVTANNIGIIKTSEALTADRPGAAAGGYNYVGFSGNKENNATATSYGATYGAGDIIGVALDLTAGTLVFYKNGTSQGTAFSSLSGEFIPSIGDGTGGSGLDMVANFGQRPFAYTAPSGFKALCTANLPAPLVVKPSTVMDVLTWTGTGGGRTLSGLGFSPDLVWGKSRSAAYNHQLYDIIRDTGASKVLMSNSTAAEGGANAALYGYVSGFNSNGFATTAGTTDNSYWNELNTTYAAWTWDAGSSTVTNTQGSITSSVRANATAGFSVISYVGTGSAGASIGHGLGVAPAFALFKNRSVSSDWQVYHVSLGNAQSILLQSTAAAVGSSAFNSTSPTSTIITLGAGTSLNNNGSNHICYAFAPVVGYSSFGSYTGNGSSDGVFVYTGFRPKFLIIKRTDSAGSWMMRDSVRDPYNVVSADLYANLSNAESSYAVWDFVSNGFKARGSGGDINGSGVPYVYIAFAESPFNYARAR